jgi:hypothetical protein
MKKNIANRLLQMAILLLSFCLFSCGGGSKNSTITHLPVQMKIDGNWSLLEIETGKIIFEGEFKKRPSVVVEGIFTLTNDEGEKFYNKLIDDKKFEQIAGPFVGGSLFNQGVAIVCKEDSHLSAIGVDGNELFTLEPKEGVVIKKAGQCFEGMIKFMDEKGMWGFLDRKGDIAIKPQFDFVDDFKNGRARATMHNDKENKFVLINKSGEIESEISKGYIGPLGNGIVAYSDSKKEFGVLKIGNDWEKQINASSKFEGISIHNEDIYYSVDNDWGHINKDGEILIRAKFESLSRLDDEMFLGVRKDGEDLRYEIINSKGETIKKDEIDEEVLGAFNLYSGGKFMLKDGKEYQLMNSKGELVGNNPVKNWKGYEEVALLENNFSQFVESKYFDWTKIEDMINSIKPGSLANFTLGLNCVKSSELLNNMVNNSTSSEDKGDADFGRGLTFAHFEAEFEDFNGSIGFYIGDGYEDNNDSKTEEPETVNESEVYDSTAVDSGGDLNNSGNVQQMAIKDNAPDWSTYQSAISGVVDIGNAGSLSINLGFDDYLKKAVTKNEIVDYGYTTMVEERIVGYDKNLEAKLNSVTLEFNVQNEKSKKLETMLTKKFGKGYQQTGESYGVKYYIDSKGHNWELNGKRIKLYQQNVYDPYSSVSAYH